MRGDCLPRVNVVQLVRKHAVSALIVLLLTSLAATFWHISDQQDEAVRLMAVRQAEARSNALREFRTLYTSEVVTAARRQGIEFAHDYVSRKGTLPLPITLTRRLTENLSDQKGEASSKLYSPEPFPWRQATGGLRDVFARQAWAALSKNPSKPFQRVEEGVLRYATADLMRSSCVNCHNTHPDTPRRDWQEGDLRGVLEVDVPLSTTGAGMKAMLWKEFALLSALLIAGFAGMGITLRKLHRRSRDSQATAEQLTKLSSASEQSGAHIFITDREGRIEYANPAFISRTGYTLEELRGNTPRMLKSGQHDPALFEELWATILDGRPFSALICNRCKDGSLYYEDKTITPLRDKRGKIAHFVSTGIDVTEARELEERLRQSQKMEAIGRLAGGVAHDFNNLLTAIIGHAELLEISAGLDESGAESLDCIKAAADRATRLTRQLLAFSRKQVLQPVVLDVNRLVESSTRMLGRLIEEDVSLVTTLQPDLASVEADPGQLDQVIMNLAVNARDAMPEGGRVEIRTIDLHLAEPSTSHPGVPPGDWVLLEVSDTGCGMDRSTRSRVFEPFFTSKDQGTGLGLSTVYGIVKQSDGYIQIESELGVGTRVAIYLPSVGGVGEVRQSRTSSGSFDGDETILVVEDEQILWDVIRSTLQAQGYSVLLAGDGREALELASAHAGDIHLLLSDVVLPGMSGKEVAEHLQRARTGLRVLYMSGYMDDVIAKHGVLPSHVQLLHKPFTRADLARRVREVLDASPVGDAAWGW